MNLPALYQLAEQFRALSVLAELEGDDDEHALEAIRTTLDALQGDIEVKAAGVGAYVLNLEAWAKAAADAAKKLVERGKRIQKRADALREYLRGNMAAVGVKKIDAPEFTLTRRANPPSVVIDADAEIPEQYLQPADPVIDRIVRAVDMAASRCSQHPKQVAIDLEVLREILLIHFPPRDPDKKAIGALLKAARDAHEAAVELARKMKQPEPVAPPSPIAGCRLEQGERLEIKP